MRLSELASGGIGGGGGAGDRLRPLVSSRISSSLRPSSELVVQSSESNSRDLTTKPLDPSPLNLAIQKDRPSRSHRSPLS